VKFDLNLVYYLLSYIYLLIIYYINMDFVYFEIKKFDHRIRLIRCGCFFLTTRFILK